MINLLKILKAGDKVYSIIHGKDVKIKEIHPDKEMCILTANFSFNTFGSVIPGGRDCLIFPSENEKTWDNFSPFKKGEHVLASNAEGENRIGIFSHMENGINYLYHTVADGKPDYTGYTNCEYFNL